VTQNGVGIQCRRHLPNVTSTTSSLLTGRLSQTPPPQPAISVPLADRLPARYPESTSRKSGLVAFRVLAISRHLGGFLTVARNSLKNQRSRPICTGMQGFGVVRKRNVSINPVSVAPFGPTDLDRHLRNRSFFEGMGHASSQLFGMTRPEMLFFSLWMLVFLFGGRHTW
jgi:hypothetical protein